MRRAGRDSSERGTGPDGRPGPAAHLRSHAGTDSPVHRSAYGYAYAHVDTGTNVNADRHAVANARADPSANGHALTYPNA